MKIKKIAKTTISAIIAAVVGVSSFVIDSNPAQAAVGPILNNKSAQMTQEHATVEILAESQYQWAGLAVMPVGGRVFVSFPAWGAAPPDYSIAEIKDGAPVPLFKGQPFTSVRRLYLDSLLRLWALDEGDAAKQIAPKLLLLDLASETISKEYSLAAALTPNSRISDVRIDHITGSAFLTDSGDGALIVLDLNSGDAYRAIENTSEVKKNLKMFFFPYTGSYNDLRDVYALELSSDHKLLYFQAICGDIMYAVPVKVLVNQKLTSQQRSKQITIESLYSTPMSGMVLKEDSDGSVLMMGDLPDAGIWIYSFLDETHKGGVFDVGVDVKWADSFAVDKLGDLYFTETQNNYPLDRREIYRLFRVKWDQHSKAKRAQERDD